MIDVVSNLVGEIVEIYEWQDGYGREGRSSYSLRGRGVARAIYVADKHLMVLLEHNLGYESAAFSDRAQDGGFEAYSLHDKRARVVQRCGRCLSWDQKVLLVQTRAMPAPRDWEHVDGEGCKKVGHGG